MRPIDFVYSCRVFSAAFAWCAVFAAAVNAGDPLPPPPVPGVCCVGPSMNCFQTENVLEDCFNNGRPYIIGAVCGTPNPCTSANAGACCLPGGLCVENYDATACANDGGVFQGAGSTCSNPCTASSQACCFQDGSCMDLTASQCAMQGGITLPGQTCASSPCGAGACCTGAACVVANVYNCLFNGFVHQGAGTVCEPDPCVPADGACCLPNLSCQTMTQNDCIEAGGNFQGGGTNCAQANCGTAPCCMAEAGCQVLSATDCAAQGGILMVGAESCEGNPCGVGACCTGVDCVQADAYTCLFNGYEFQGAGLSCTPDPCVEPCICIGDANMDFTFDARDIQTFVDCMLAPASNCSCADTTGDGQVTEADIAPFVNIIMNTTGECL